MALKVPYKYYKFVMLGVWALAVLCIAATWVGFAVPGKAAICFGAIVDTFLSLFLIALVVLLALNVREDYKKRAWLFGALAAVHIIFFILVLGLKDQIARGNSGVFALPAIHTIILVAISVVGIYFWIRNRFTFKSFAQQDAVAAFGGAVEEPKAPETPTESNEPKKARDEKTGIVSL
ncbi:MAG: hypothetical protein ACOQNV_02110 [Mycoplasmoidaceae bacterium]